MLRLLVSMDRTVESSFALRAACRLVRETGGYLEALHVVDPSTQPMDHGAGWAIHTYKRQRIKDAYRDMGGVIASEREAYESVPDLKVVSGDPVKEIAREVRGGSFDALFMGSIHLSDGPERKIPDKLLPRISCPLFILRHYRPLKKVVLLVDSEENMGKVVDRAAALFAGLPLTMDVICHYDTYRREGVEDLLEKTRRRVADTGLDVGTTEAQERTTQEILDLAPEYDLVSCGIRGRIRQRSVARQLLLTMPTSLMLCP